MGWRWFTGQVRDFSDLLRETPQWLLVIGLGVFLADAASAGLEQHLAPPPVPALPLAAVEAQAAGPDLAAQPELTRLLATSEPSVAVAPFLKKSNSAPRDTTVTVTLHGSMAGGNGSGLALLTVAGESLTACPGQPLLDWTVTKVFPTSVVIERAKVTQTLQLDQPVILATATSSTSEENPPLATSGPVSANLGLPTQREIRDQLDHRMAEVIKQGSIKPVVREGTVIGYGIKVKDPAFLLARIGLQTGDIVTAVNANPCTGPGDMQKILNIVRNSPSLNFEIERAGKPVTHRVELEL